ncbi:PspC domain-containing protein [Schaalia sp. lx-100]|uniref:PspC domain-containing protein n=1 Tax=Schaalia sp. lx-100 TaxID=2899081 RepID=UPI001E32C22C|nr:PspC domain-containing protein [Schaalia sp. lx-100]MCD4557229.1 PspC domain-containing protein [Schaalia sp. lx-100]
MNTQESSFGPSDPHNWRTHGGPPPASAPQPDSDPYNSHSFFRSLRSSGFYRTDSRFIGGVCGAIAQKIGWDPALIRGLTLIFVFFMPLILALYGLAWAFLPEQSDGRIHAEELIKGRFNIAHLGQIFLLFIAFSGSYSISSVLFSSRFSSPFTLFIPSMWVLCILLIIFFIARNKQSTSPGHTSSHYGVPAYAPPTPQANAPSSSHTQPHGPGVLPHENLGPSRSPQVTEPTSSAGSMGYPPAGTTSFAPPSATTPPTSSWQTSAHTYASPYAPPTMAGTPTPVYATQPMRSFTKTRRVSTATNLAVTGIITLIITASFFLMRYFWILSQASTGTPTHIIWLCQTALIGGGISLIFVGLVIAFASVRDRSAGWLVGLSVFGVLLAVPTSFAALPLAAGVNVSWLGSWSNHTTLYSFNTIESTWEADVVHLPVYAANLSIKLEDAPQKIHKTITFTGSSASNTTVTLRSDQPLQIIASGGINRLNVNNVTLDATSTSLLDSSIDEETILRTSNFTEENGITLFLSPEVETLTLNGLRDASSSSKPSSSATPAPPSGS